MDGLTDFPDALPIPTVATEGGSTAELAGNKDVALHEDRTKKGNRTRNKKPSKDGDKAGTEVESPDKNEVFYVEKILKKRVTEGKVLYFVKWRNFPPRYNTWEPVSSFADPSCVEDYENRQKWKLSHSKGQKMRRFKHTEVSDSDDEEDERSESDSDIQSSASVPRTSKAGRHGNHTDAIIPDPIPLKSSSRTEHAVSGLGSPYIDPSQHFKEDKSIQSTVGRPKRKLQKKRVFSPSPSFESGISSETFPDRPSSLTGEGDKKKSKIDLLLSSKKPRSSEENSSEPEVDDCCGSSSVTAKPVSPFVSCPPSKALQNFVSEFTAISVDGVEVIFEEIFY